MKPEISQKRADGFPRQHMAVLPEPVRAAARRHPLLRGLLVTDAGYFPQAAGHLVERTGGAPTDLVIVCLRGRGWIRVGGVTYAMEPGSVAWLVERKAHAYGAETGDPWTILWAHVMGDEVRGWRDLLGVDSAMGGKITQVPVDRIGEVTLDRVHAALESGYSTRELVTAAAEMRGALCALVRLLAAGAGSRTARDRVVASIERLRGDWRRTHRLDELAAAAGLSPAHYTTLFRELSGFAPIDFVMRLRVQHACRLLDATAASVSAIAAEVGYADPYYFTRCFRRIMGCSPRAYRSIQKG